MHEILLKYQPVEPTTWVYLSSLLIIALFCKFNRIWSLRNFDLIGLILLAPGLVLMDYGRNRHQPTFEMVGYIWMFVVTGILLLRMLLDTAMVRRPLLEPNLSVGGMVFLIVALSVFLMAKVLVVDPSAENMLSSRAKAKAQTVRLLKPNIDDPDTIRPLPSLNQQFQVQDQAAASKELVPPTPATPIPGTLLPTVTPVEQPVVPSEKNNGQKTDSAPPTSREPIVIAAEQKQNEQAKLARLGPGYWLVRSLPVLATPIFQEASEQANRGPQQLEEARNLAASKALLIIAHLAVVLGMIWIGQQHFGNLQAGVAASLLYLLMPYTAMYIGWVQHVLPAACLTWAIVAYRRPLIAGTLIGLACGTIYYPVFLLPLWISFYWKRGLLRFLVGLGTMILILIGVTALNASSMDDFLGKLQLMTGFMFPTMQPNGFWGLLDENFRIYRITVLAAHIALAGSFALWPVQKNLGTLLSCSAAVMLSTQFWAAFDGGNSVAWFLPLVLLTIFRPNLEDRVALSVLGDGWLSAQRLRVNPISKAA